MTVAEAVAKYAEAKGHEGISRHYAKDIRLILNAGSGRLPMQPDR